MNSVHARTLAFAASLSFGAAAFAAPPLNLDIEQKATAAFVTGLSVSHSSTINHYATIERVIFYSNRALQKAASVTTPAALMASSSGIVVPCETSGTMTARMAPKYPRVFKFEWQDCHFPLDGFPNTLDGPGEIVLPGDTFTPTKVAAIRFGNANTDLASTRVLSFPWSVSRNTMLRNLRVIGNIPMTISPFVTNSVSPFAYVIAGFTDETATYQDLSSGTPESSAGFRTEFDSVAYAGTFAYDTDATLYTEDLLALFGTLTFTRSDPPPYGVTTERFRYEGFRVRNVSNYSNGDRTQAIDGRVDYTPNPFFGTGCQSGGFTFKTHAPIHTTASPFQTYDAGNLSINGTARFSLYSAANVPPSLPAPTQATLVHLDLAGVGSFNYDVNDLYLDLRPVSRCM
jgi:hypothetical protein